MAFLQIQKHGNLKFKGHFLTQALGNVNLIIIFRATSSTTISMLYGRPLVQSLDDPTIVFMNYLVDCMAKNHEPGAFLVDIFPILEHLPRWCSKWRRDAEKLFRYFDSKFQDMFYEVKKKVVSILTVPFLFQRKIDYALLI
jgi:hypothetical protein